MNRTYFLVFILEGQVCLHRTGKLQFFQPQWFGHRLGLLSCWMVCLENELRSFCSFWGCTQVLHFGLFCWLWELLHFFYRILAHSSDIMVIWVKFAHSQPFSSLIPKMLMFILAISCLTMSNLLWFMDLSFQVLYNNTVLYSIGFYFHHQTHPQLNVIPALAQPLHSFWSYQWLSASLPQLHIGQLLTWRESSLCVCVISFVFL